MPVTEADFRTLVSKAKERTDRFNKKATAENRLPREFDIDASYLNCIWNEQGGCCNLCGIEMDLVGETHDPGSANMMAASTDKLVPDKGYVKGNVALVHYVCNAFKSRNDIHNLYALARGIVETFKKRYPQTEVTLSKRLVTKDNIHYYPYPEFTFSGEGTIAIGGSATAKMTPNASAPQTTSG